MVFQSWAFSETPPAKMVSDVVANQNYNANYIKSTLMNKHCKTPIPKTGPRKQVEGDDQWGYVTAKEKQPPSKMESFNQY